jgi:peptidoglycan/LPS O-acetylase OafA/YrhL
MVLAAVAWWLNAIDPWSSTTATVGAALLLAGLVSGRPTGVSRVLRSRPLRHVGVLSYSLYLWNPILLAFYLRTVGTVPSRSVLGLLWLAASLAVAEASYSWVERPARDRLRGRRPIVLPQQPVPAASEHPTGVMPIAVTTRVATAESAST